MHRFAWWKTLRRWTPSCYCGDDYPCRTRRRELFEAELEKMRAFFVDLPAGWL